MPRVLFLASHRLDRAPGQRFRFEQYLGHLAQNGFEVEFSPILDEAADRTLYSPDDLLGKLGVVLKAWRTRRRDRATFASRDVVFVFREAWMLGGIPFERAVKAAGARLVFDFDDSIWLSDTSAANKRWEWLKNPEKTADIIGLSDMVFAGNAYLADYARRFNSNVRVVPTTIDTDLYRPRTQEDAPGSGPVVIGWSGSTTTIKHFAFAEEFLLEVKDRFGAAVEFQVIGDERFEHAGLGIRGRAWRSATEVADLSRFDIGIMPLPDDEWARGKCGLKGLQYMALGIPTVMSPVGVNTEIIRHGENGVLASTRREWVDALARLVESPGLRRTMGRAARQTVLDRYSVASQRDTYVRLLREAADAR